MQRPWCTRLSFISYWRMVTQKITQVGWLIFSLNVERKSRDLKKKPAAWLVASEIQWATTKYGRTCRDVAYIYIYMYVWSLCMYLNWSAGLKSAILNLYLFCTDFFLGQLDYSVFEDFFKDVSHAILFESIWHKSKRAVTTHPLW